MFCDVKSSFTSLSMVFLCITLLAMNVHQHRTLTVLLPGNRPVILGVGTKGTMGFQSWNRFSDHHGECEVFEQ